MTKSDTWMPLYIGDYLADTMRLTTVQHGAYLLLLMEYWRSGPLPDDDTQLASIVKLDPRTWKSQAASVVRGFFARGDDGLLHQHRADAEIARAAAISSKRRAAAVTRHQQTACKTGANAGANAGANDTAKPMQKPSESTHTRVVARPSPSSSLRSEEFSEASASAPVEPGAHAVRPPNIPGNPPESDGLTAVSAHLPPADIRTEFWTEGLAVFRRITGKTDGPSRAFLGRMLRDLGDDCATGLAVLRQAEADRPGDPIAWLQASVQARNRPRETHAQRQNRAVLDALGLAPELPTCP